MKKKASSGKKKQKQNKKKTFLIAISLKLGFKTVNLMHCVGSCLLRRSHRHTGVQETPDSPSAACFPGYRGKVVVTTARNQAGLVSQDPTLTNILPTAVSFLEAEASKFSSKCGIEVNIKE